MTNLLAVLSWVPIAYFVLQWFSTSRDTYPVELYLGERAGAIAPVVLFLGAFGPELLPGAAAQGPATESAVKTGSWVVYGIGLLLGLYSVASRRQARQFRTALRAGEVTARPLMHPALMGLAAAVGSAVATAIIIWMVTAIDRQSYPASYLARLIESGGIPRLVAQDIVDSAGAYYLALVGFSTAIMSILVGTAACYVQVLRCRTEQALHVLRTISVTERMARERTEAATEAVAEEHARPQML